MASKRHVLVTASAVIGLACFVGGSVARAAGGVYLDNVQLKNNGKVIINENFDDNNISDWYQLTEATMVLADKSSTNRILHMNRHGMLVGMARHRLNINPAGVTEFGAWVNVAPEEEQYGWNSKSINNTLYMTLEYKATKGNVNKIRLEISLIDREQGCRIRATHDAPGSVKFDVTKTPVLPTGKWAYVMIKVDPSTKTATAFLDETKVAAIPYDPAVFSSIVGFTLNCGLGDGVQLANNPTK